MSRGITLNDDIMDDFHQDADEDRLLKYKDIIQTQPITIITLIDAKNNVELSVPLPCNISKWQSFWLWWFFGLKTERNNET